MATDVSSSGFAKILKQKWHTDLLLKAGDSNGFAAISAHKLVNAARSEVFKKMLESKATKASSDQTLFFSEMRHEELETLVKFMYNDHGLVSSSKLKKHVRSLYLAAQRYEIPHLRDLCRNELISSLSSSNALDELSQVPLDKPLTDAVLSFIARNINTFLDSSMTTENNLEIFLGGFAKVFNEQWQVDVRLKAGDSNENAAISAHKLVLAARSEVFKKMLESDKFKGTADQIETVTLPELKQEELEALVGFIYNNRSVLSEKEKIHAQTLFVAADKYDIPHLRDLCRKELISSLKLANVINILELSLIPFDEALNDAAVMFVVRNLLAICDTVEFKLFVVTNPDLTVDIMKSSKSRRWKHYYIF
ncbi:hypothetical protein HID58_016880 [Brassica napus]|uniref:BTB domain-containing protein n=2 Tax=Brassica TaxID=3705 RepID=A0ABQ8D5H8_BRANA|nr:hypothetical protein HID58_016880 [Brassica napus]